MEIGFFSSTIVQVAISIVISWALFALLCSMIHEIIVQLKSERGRFYRNKVKEKLFDSSNQINWGLLIYNHSSIRLLTKSDNAPPTEIDAKTMAESLIHVVANSQASRNLKTNEFIPQGSFKNELLNNLDFATANLGQSDVILLLRNALDKAKIKATDATSFDEKKLYEDLVDDVKFWFEQFGSRTSMWYKKLSRKRLFLIGLLVACITNIDSIALVRYYIGNPTARTAMIDYYQKNKIQLEALSAQYDPSNNSTEKQEKTSKEIKNDIEGLSKQIVGLKKDIELPIGWEVVSSLPPSLVVLKILGILISALAASLGAPFWFDLLKKATSATETVIKKV